MESLTRRRIMNGSIHGLRGNRISIAPHGLRCDAAVTLNTVNTEFTGEQGTSPLVSNSKTSTSPGHRNHQFDLLRIIFATLVILAHAPELIDGNNSREIFSRLTHSGMSFGMLGVDGFFLLSGFLIVKSWQQNPSLLNFLHKRLLRIMPGYLVGTILSIFVIGVLAPGIRNFFRHLSIHNLFSILAVGAPSTPPVLPGSHYQDVNQSLWTIQYELRCYFLVALFGICGLFRRPALWHCHGSPRDSDGEPS